KERGHATPRWTPENRPVVDGAKPASGEAAPGASLVPRLIVIEQAPRGDVAGRAGDIQIWPRRRSGPSWAKARCVISTESHQKALRSLWRRVRQLFGPHVSTCA